MWKMPRRLFQAANARDVDDFNETVYEFSSESGRVSDHNCRDTIFGAGTDADRITFMDRGATGIRHVRASGYNAAGVLPIEAGAGWVTILTAELTCQPAYIRAQGNLSTHGGTPPILGYLAIRIDGVLINESIKEILYDPAPVHAFGYVGQGHHTVDLVAQISYDTGMSAANSLLTVVAAEK